MFVDCATCPVRGRSCDDCIVPVLLDEPVGADRLLALTDTHTMTGSTP